MFRIGRFSVFLSLLLFVDISAKIVNTGSHGNYSLARNKMELLRQKRNGWNPTNSKALKSNIETQITANSWTQTNAPAVVWFSTASSANGEYLFAGVNYGALYIFISGQSEWVANSNVPETGYYFGVSCSSSGQYAVVVNAFTGIYYSMNYGVTWNPSTGVMAQEWYSCASSGTGQYIAAVVNGGGIYLSTNNYGEVFTAVANVPSLAWVGIDISYSGEIMVAVANGGGSAGESAIYLSSNYGQSFALTAPSLTSYEFSAVSISATGTYVVVSTCGNGILYSTSAGESFTSSYALEVSTECWVDISSSSSGEYVIAVPEDGYAYMSSDYGELFEPSEDSPSAAYASVASDSTGGQVVAAVANVGIYLGSIVVVAQDDIYTVDTPGPTPTPTFIPTLVPTMSPLSPTVIPTVVPTAPPSSTMPTASPTISVTTVSPSAPPSTAAVSTTPPTAAVDVSSLPSYAPTTAPTAVENASTAPTIIPSATPTTASNNILAPSTAPTAPPTASASTNSTYAPTAAPTPASNVTTTAPTVAPTVAPTPTGMNSTAAPTASPTSAAVNKTLVPSTAPTTSAAPTRNYTAVPTAAFTAAPTPTATGTATPTVSPTPAMNSTMSPTAAPSVSQAPSTHIIREPTAAPSASPTSVAVNATVVPTITPTQVPSGTGSPSHSPSPLPGSPTAAPSVVPSSVPSLTNSPTTMAPTSVNATQTPTISFSPTVKPTFSPSVIPLTPTFIPTLSPTQLPTYQSEPALTFTSNVTLDNVTAPEMDQACQDAIIATTALALGVEVTDVHYIGTASVVFIGPGRQLRTRVEVLSNTTTDLFDLVAMTGTSVAVRGGDNATQLYAEYASSYANYVTSGEFTETLRQQSVVYSAVATLNATAAQGSVSKPFVVQVPTMTPTSSPTYSTAPGVIENIGTIVPGVILFALVLFALYLRYPMRDALNELNNTVGEIGDAVIKCAIIILSLNIIANYSSDTRGVSFILLVFSKFALFLLWGVFLIAFFVPYRDNNNKQKVQLALLLHKDSWKVRIAFSVYGLLVTMSMFDLTFLRLMPWVRTKVTDSMMGYPNKFMIRCCLYGTFLSHMIQSVAIIINIAFESVNEGTGSRAEMENEKAILLLAFSVFNVLRSFISIIFIVRVAQSDKLKLAVVNEADVAALADFVDQNPDSTKRVESEDNNFSGSRKRSNYTPSYISDMLHNASSDRSLRSDTLTTVQNPINPSLHREMSLGDNSSVNRRGGSFLMSDVDSSSQDPWDHDINNSGVPKFVGGGSVRAETVVSDVTGNSGDEVDERGIRFSANTRFADQTLDILRNQLKKEGKIPVEFIPLADLKSEIAIIFSKANNGVPYDEGRLDYLLMCMDYNPDYKLEKEAETRRWRNEIGPFASDCLEMMRGFVPPHIFHASQTSLVKEDGLSPDLAKRIITKKCLWLVRISTADIGRMHIAELTGRFNPEAMGLDIVEIAAIFASVPEKFGNDPDGKKERWRASIEQNLKNLVIEKSNMTLMKSKLRNAAYNNQEPKFAHRETLHTMHVTSGEDAFKPRSSFRNLNLHNNSGSLQAMGAYNSAGVYQSNITIPEGFLTTPRSSEANDNFAPIPRASLMHLNDRQSVSANALPVRVAMPNNNNNNRPQRVGSLRGSVIGDSLNKIFSAKKSSDASSVSGKPRGGADAGGGDDDQL